jgi:hypothetical protein
VGTAVVNYSVATDIWQLIYRPEGDIFPGTSPEGAISNGELVPEGDWTALVSPYAVDSNCGIGLVAQLQSGELVELLAHARPPAATTGVWFVPFPGRQITLRIEHVENILVLSYSDDQFSTWVEVASFSPASPVHEVGVVLRYDREDLPAAGAAGQVRLLPGIWDHSVQEEVFLGEPDQAPAQREAPPEVTVMSTTEPLVHAIIGAQFGDLEFDVGKSVRWATWFCDNLFVLDVNLGTPRYWIVNWAETFPDAGHTVTGINYFVLPKEFRAEQWKQYKLSFGEPHDDDWILWLDASEGLNIDNRSLPDDYDFEPFKSFLWREIQRAQDLGQNYAVLPNYVFLRSDDIVNVTYPIVADTGGMDIGPLQAISTPYYQAYQGLKRLWKASELKKPDFDWSQLDTVVAPTAGAKAAIVSYAYAHWNLQDIEPPATEVPTLTAENDDGYRMRQLMSRVRPVPGIPVSDTWIPPSSDPAGLPGPWSPADANNPDPIVPSGPYLNAVVGTATLPDPGPLPSQVTFVWKAQSDLPLTGESDQHIASQDGTPDQGGMRSWNVYRPAFGLDHWFWLQSPDPWGSGLVQHGVQEAPATGEIEYLAMAVTHAPVLTTHLYRLVNDVWTEIGAGATNPSPPVLLDSTSPIRIGRGMNGAGGWKGRIYWVELRTGLNPAAGTVLWRFDAADDFTDSDWTLTSPDAIVINTDDVMEQPVTPDPSLLGLVTPLYDNAFRINMRDGVWYEEGLSGNIPLKWDDANQRWTTDYDPAEWADAGVKAWDPTAVP